MTQVPRLALTLLFLVAAAPGWADQAALEGIQAACEANLNVPPGACPCLAEIAGAELDDTQQAWLAAALAEQTDEALIIKDEMDPMQALEAGMFMVNSAEQCAGG